MIGGERISITSELSVSDIISELTRRWCEIYDHYPVSKPQVFGLVFDLLSAVDVDFLDLEILKDKGIISSKQFENLVQPYQKSQSMKVQGLLPGLRQ